MLNILEYFSRYSFETRCKRIITKYLFYASFINQNTDAHRFLYFYEQPFKWVLYNILFLKHWEYFFHVWSFILQKVSRIITLLFQFFFKVLIAYKFPCLAEIIFVFAGNFFTFFFSFINLNFSFCTWRGIILFKNFSFLKFLVHFLIRFEWKFN